MNAIPRLKEYSGPVLLSCGFRPFFFFGACHAALAMAVWLLLFFGEMTIATLFAFRDWHAHEMVFGYLTAVLTGFLLTAIPNWTGRLPLQGPPLLALVLIWFAGRVAVAWSVHLGWAISASIDCMFLLVVVAAVAREIIAGRNWRNLKVLIPVCFLALANIGFHTEAYTFGIAEFSIRAAIAVFVTLIMLVGGRVVPSFTRNWLAREKPGRLPAPFGRFDAGSLAFSTASLCLWVLRPEGIWTAATLLVAAALQGVRLARWAGDRTTRERLVFILHIAYAFIPVGFALAGLAAIGWVPASAALHAWMAGAAGTMTLAVMTRASLGHTGRELVAGAGTQVIYIAVVIAACARVVSAFSPEWMLVLLHFAAIAWIAAFGTFAVLYGPVLFRQSKR
ncbi:MAG: NnrS family protein [Xanthobacteraceae bacterium]